MFCITCHGTDSVVPGLVMHDRYCPGNAFPNAHVIGSPECPVSSATPRSPCERCTHRATAYGLGPCDAHDGDAWPTRKDN